MQTSLPVSFLSTGGQQRIFVMTLFSDKSFCSKIFSLFGAARGEEPVRIGFSRSSGGGTLS
jgi:hypothetical protein